MSFDYDIIVVGAGIIGSWTSYLLVKKEKKKVLLLDQFSLPHTQGSSHGASRLVKHSHRKSHCADLIPDAFKLWEELEKESGVKLLHPTGHLSIVDTNSTGDLYNVLKRNLADKGIPHTDYLSGDELDQKYPGFKFQSADFKGYYEENGKVIMAHLALETLRSELLRYGVDIKQNTKATKVVPLSNGGVEVFTANKSYKCKKVVLTCGPWINKMMETTGLQLKLEADRVTTYYWKEKKEGIYSRFQNFPPFMTYCEKYHVYSIPSDDYPGYLKVCYHARLPIDPDLPDVISPESQKFDVERLQVLKSFIQKYLPMLDTNSFITEKAVQTCTPDSNFIISKHPKCQDIVIGAGFSGHGFGCSPSVGKILVRLATDQCGPKTDQSFPLQVKTNNHSKL